MDGRGCSPTTCVRFATPCSATASTSDSRPWPTTSTSKTSSTPSSPPSHRRESPMTTSLLRKVKAKTAIHAHRKVRSVLDGEHGSIHKGRSMDFDDLREYVLGDDVKDLDWKATARSGRPLIKRYVATRQHAVML